MRDSAIRTKARRAASKDLSVPGSGLEKRHRTDLGLAILSAVGLPGVCYTLDEIAVFAGCTESAIHAIYMRALRRLRHRLLFMKDQRLVEAMQSYFDRRETASKRPYFE